MGDQHPSKTIELLEALLDDARRIACSYHAAATRGDDDERSSCIELFGDDVAVELYGDDDSEPAVDTEAAEVWRRLSDAQRFELLQMEGVRASNTTDPALCRARLMVLQCGAGELAGLFRITDLGKRVAAYGRALASEGGGR